MKQFLLLNTLQFVFSLIGIFASVHFILLIKLNRTLHTLSNVLVCNSCLAVLILASDIFIMSIYILNRDLSLKGTFAYNIFLCQFRVYISQISFCALIHSYVIQVFQRLTSIIYADRLYYRNLCPYLYAIAIQWFIAIGHILPIIFNNNFNQSHIKEDFLCQITIHTSRTIIYICSIIYIIPLGLIAIQYCIVVVLFQREKHRNHTDKIHQHIRHQMKCIRRIFIYVSLLLFLGIPYYILTVFDTVSLIHTSRHAHRIGFAFLGLATGCIMLMMTYFTIQ